MAHTAEIAQLEALLNSGADDITVDGIRTTYNVESIRRRLAELKQADAVDSLGAARPWPSTGTVNLSTGFPE